jgi:hypothetical protein
VEALLEKIDYDGAICLVDSFAVPVCTLAKAPPEIRQHGNARLRCHGAGRILWL